MSKTKSRKIDWRARYKELDAKYEAALIKYEAALAYFAFENAELKERILALEKRLGLDSTTSSKPPSSDGFGKGKRPPISSREDKEKKAAGGQQGHKGDTLKQDEHPDEIITSTPNTCPACGADLSGVAAKTVTKRQEHDIFIAKHVTEHQVEEKLCTCGQCVSGKFPPHVTAPVQYGSAIKSVAVYLAGHFIGKDRLSEVLSDLFGMSMSDTTILSYETQAAQNLEVFCDQVQFQAQIANVKHVDETQIRINGGKAWIHVLCTPKLTSFYSKNNRSCPWSWTKGILVSDHFKGYNRLPVKHAYCNAHHARELKALVKYDGELWAAEMRGLLAAMLKCKRADRLSDKLREHFSCRYDDILQAGLNYHNSLPVFKVGSNAKRTGHNLALRLQEKKEGVLMFMYNWEVPFTNNLAEQALRPVKTQQKVSGGYRTERGAQTFAAIRSLISTVRKNGLNVLDFIKLALDRRVSLSMVLPNFQPQLLLPAPQAPLLNSS